MRLKLGARGAARTGIKRPALVGAICRPAADRMGGGAAFSRDAACAVAGMQVCHAMTKCDMTEREREINAGCAPGDGR